MLLLLFKADLSLLALMAERAAIGSIARARWDALGVRAAAISTALPERESCCCRTGGGGAAVAEEGGGEAEAEEEENHISIGGERRGLGI